MTRPTPPARRLLAYATLLTAAVGLLAGVAAGLSNAGLLGPPLRNLRVGASGPGALATARLVGALSWVALGLFVLGPVGVAAALVARGDDRPWTAVAWAVAALVGFPVLALVLVVGLSTPSPYPDVAALVAAPLVASLAYRFAARDGRERPPWAPTRPLAVALALGLAFVVAGVVGTGVLADPTAGLAVAEHRGPPAVAWAFEYEAVGDGRGVVTITHGGGRVVPADDVGVRSTGFADVPGVDQTARGEWQGETTPGEAGPTVAPGDSVTVGVAGDCVVRVVHDDPPFVATMGKYRCPDAGAGDDASVGATRPGGDR